MTTLPPIPNVGQPIDTQYLYGIVTAIHDLNKAMTSNTSKQSSLDGKKTLTSQMVAFTQTKNFAAETVIVGQRKDFSVDFTDAFASNPVVTVTPYAIENTAASTDVTAVITNITQKNVSGVLIFGTAGKATVSLNVIALGVPS